MFLEILAVLIIWKFVKGMNQSYESILSNSFYFILVLYYMLSKKSDDFAQVLEAWAKVIGVNLDRQ